MEPRSSHTQTPRLAAVSLHREVLSPPDVIVADRRWRSAVPHLERRISRAVQAAAHYLDRPRAPNILLEADRAVRRLNHDFRGRNKPTNVLTFAAPEGFGDGDIVLGFETVQREARAAHRSVGAHLTHLIVHGLLHLAGHDHHAAGEARMMEALETRILSTLGVANPWRMGGRAMS
ncbi:rRNA maturation RNase YbeY [Kozakia baliensis]|uniref:rRNA maturation RNase YbeY n=1 Tax=Kozakia baliensis TaxID=153496 RepID=UPI0009F4D861|nr:rRNA maturation RNase YbeY [Kozakia baliensis]